MSRRVVKGAKIWHRKVIARIRNMNTSPLLLKKKVRGVRNEGSTSKTGENTEVLKTSINVSNIVASLIIFPLEIKDKFDMSKIIVKAMLQYNLNMSVYLSMYPSNYPSVRHYILVA